VVPSIPVAGLALILGVDRFMSEARSITNFIGNGVAAIVVARWENELDRDTLRRELAAGAREIEPVSAALRPPSVVTAAAQRAEPEA
jgi:aerobic C4-dicarboxylate transport protein